MKRFEVIQPHLSRNYNAYELDQRLRGTGFLVHQEIPKDAVFLTRDQVEELLGIAEAISMDSGFRRILNRKMEEIFGKPSVSEEPPEEII